MPTDNPWFIMQYDTYARVDTGYFWCRRRGWVKTRELRPTMEYLTHGGALRAANRMLELGRIDSYTVIKYSKLKQEMPSCIRVRA